MTTRVVNVRDFDLSAGAEWPFIYVGRAVPRYGFGRSPLANPFKLRKGATDAERAECLAKYRAWLEAHPLRDSHLEHLARLVRLTGKPLGCWCCNWDGITEPAPLCHAVVLAMEVDRVLLAVS